MNQQEKYNKKTDLYAKGINQYIVDLVEPGKTILDVGCGSGKTGEYLKKEKKAIVVGVDISRPAIEQAKKVLDEAYCLDIEKEAFPFAENRFDIIICGDVLEHLIDPLEMLLKLKKYMKSDGYILLSIPNVANIIIRFNLFLGKFNYQPSGILDETHLRFFTLKTVRAMLGKAGLAVVYLGGTRTEYGEEIHSLQKIIHRAIFFNPVEAFLRKHWLLPLLSTQFIIKAEL